MLQHTFLSLMAIEDMSYENKIEVYLKALCDSMGVKFK